MNRFFIALVTLMFTFSTHVDAQDKPTDASRASSQSRKVEIPDTAFFGIDLPIPVLNPLIAGQDTLLMDLYLPAKSKSVGAAVVICPGGGYTHQAFQHEGYDWVTFFRERGVAAAILHYRLPHYQHQLPAADAMAAIRHLRENAEAYNLKADKIGIMGSSAGGHLASTVATHADDASMPNYQILFYPVITMEKGVTHQGSRDNLLGKDASGELITMYSNELQVTKRTPKCIMLLSDDDRTVPSENSIRYYRALKEKGVKATMHIYPSGGHGWGIRSSFKYHDAMMKDLSDWMEGE